MMAHQPLNKVRPDTVLSKAVLKAADMLGLNGKQLAEVLGVSASSITRMTSGDYVLADKSKEWELGLLLVRLYRSIDAMVAGDEHSRLAWMSNPNTDLHGVPSTLINTVQGLVQTVEYVDAYRARV